MSDCQASMYGCCPDNITPAEGPDLANCNLATDSFEFEESCDAAEFGCCPDNYSAAKGPNKEGCIDYSCRVSSKTLVNFKD